MLPTPLELILMASILFPSKDTMLYRLGPEKTLKLHGGLFFFVLFCIFMFTFLYFICIYHQVKGVGNISPYI